MARVDEFFQWVLADQNLIKCRILDCGAGQGASPYRQIIGSSPKIVGIDLDPRILENSLLDEGYIGSVYETQFPDDSFDVVFSIMVVEHLEKPVKFLTEMKRILKPTGSLYFLTPNARHYFTLLAKSMPRSMASVYHRFPWRKNRELDSVFPTYYRMNSAKLIADYSKRVGFTNVEIRYAERRNDVCLYFPERLRFIPRYYCRAVNSHKSLERIKVGLMTKLTK